MTFISISDPAGSVEVSSSGDVIAFDLVGHGTALCVDLTVDEAEEVINALSAALTLAKESKPREMFVRQRGGRTYYFEGSAPAREESENTWEHRASLIIDDWTVLKNRG